MTINIITLVILLVLSAFFSAAEVAFVSLSDAKIDTMVKKKRRQAKRIRALKQNPRRLLVTILIGNNIVNIAAASLATVVTAQLFESGVIGIATGGMTLLILIFGEIIPKSYASNKNRQFAAFAAPYLAFLQWTLFPFVLVFEWLTNVFAGKHRPEHISEEELRAMARVGAKQGAIEKEEHVMLERLFAFNDITAEDVMTPRVQMITMDHTLTIKSAEELIKKNPHTRFPIADGSPDNIIGFVHARDVLLAYIDKKLQTPITELMQPILRVPKQTGIDDLLEEFRKRQVHIALVLDEFGGTLGVITLEDVIEELVGEIVDEHDVEKDVIKRLNKNSILASGDEDIRDINDFLNVQIPGDPFDTIAEVILDAIEKVPRKDMVVELGNTTCTIQRVKNRTITKVRISKHNE